MDPKEVTLYRYVGQAEEQVIPIKGNDAVKNFMCISSKQYEELSYKALWRKGGK